MTEMTMKMGVLKRRAKKRPPEGGPKIDRETRFANVPNSVHRHVIPRGYGSRHRKVRPVWPFSLAGGSLSALISLAALSIFS